MVSGPGSVGVPDRRRPSPRPSPGGRGRNTTHSPRVGAGVRGRRDRLSVLISPHPRDSQIVSDKVAVVPGPPVPPIQGGDEGLTAIHLEPKLLIAATGRLQ